MARKYEYRDDDESYYEEREGNSGVGEKLTYLLVGGGIGAIVALLLAPKSGTELRGDIADATRKGVGKTREAAQQLGQRSGEYYENARQVAGDYYSRAGEAYTAARTRFSKTGEETVDAVPQIGGGTEADGQQENEQTAAGSSKSGRGKQGQKSNQQTGSET